MGLSGDPKDLDEILKDGYGHRQGSILWAQGAAQRMAKSYPMRPYPDDPRERMSPEQLEAERREKGVAEQVLAALRSCGRFGCALRRLSPNT